MGAHVAVVGGGFAGLSAATALAERGIRVTVFEARPTLGGRATSFVDPATAERVDNGQHILLGCYHETFRFLRRIGAEANVRVQPHLSVDFIDRSGRASRLSCPALPSPFHLLAGLVKWEALSWRDRISAAGLSMRGGPWRSAGRAVEARPAGELTVREWLIARGQTRRLIEMLWEPLAVAALNQSIDSAAAVSYAAVLDGMLKPPARNSAIALPLKPLDDLYALPAKAYIESRGGEVLTNTRALIACGASLSDARTWGEPLRLAGRTARVRPTREYPVICAVPWYALRGSFDNPPDTLSPVLEAADRTDASPIVTVNLWFDRVVTGGAFVGLPGRVFQWVFDKRIVFGEPASHLSLVSSGAASIVGLSNEALIDIALKEVRMALPAAAAAGMLRAVVVREKRATFSVAPGQPARPGARTPVPGLFLAGDWIETGLPATIEGAVVSGHRAASAVSTGTA